MQVKVNSLVNERIKEFYGNAKKAHPSLDSKQIREKVRVELKKVGSGQLQKTNFTLPKWSGCIVERSSVGWYFAYKIENGVIYVYGAEHSNNMSDNTFISHNDQKTDGNYDPQKQFTNESIQKYLEKFKFILNYNPKKGGQL
jgi:hypothetical protein